MDLKIIFGILAAVILAFAAALLLPGARTVDENPKLPWVINIDNDGHNEVFGLTLGKSTLRDAEDAFSQEATLTLFRSPEGKIDVEAYFDRIFLSGLKANIVLRMSVDEASAEAMFERGLRISQMGSGSKKVELADEDKQRLAETPFELLTYLPGADLEPELIASHFGEPNQKIKENKEIQHWLYPEKGLDIAISTETKEVFQYVLPAQFDRVTAPLVGN